MPSIGSAESRLITIRGNSGSGKSALAAGIRSARPRGIAIVGQDQLRREILHVRDRPDGLAVGYIDLSARYALDHGLHVVVEGLLHEEIYGDMLRQLIKDHRGITRCYRYQIPFDETLDRHQTKPNAASFGEEEMRCWWRDSDPLHGVTEEIIGPESTLAVSVERVLRDCGWDNRG